MKLALATRIVTATVLLGTSAFTAAAQELPSGNIENGNTNTNANAGETGVAEAYDDFGFTEEQTEATPGEVAELRAQVHTLTNLCADLYDEVHTAPRDGGDVEFTSMLTRLDGEAGAFDQSAYGAPAGMPCGEPNCCDSGCCGTGGCDTCCQPCCRSGFYAGFAAVWIRPHVPDDVAYTVDPGNSNNVYDFDRDYEFTPRVWLGYTGCDGLGGRVSYWQFDNDAGPQSLVGTANNTPIFVQVVGAQTGIGRNAFADVGETFVAGHSIRLEALDLEVTREWRRCQSYALFGLGLRYAQMDQNYTATVFDGGGDLSEQVINRHGFEGIGPTASLWLFQPFGQSNFGVYATMRGSILFGNVYQDIYEVKNGGADIGIDRYKADEVLTIGELGFGLQYNVPVTQTASAFVRAGYEAQVWWDAGGPISPYGDLGLEGFLLGFGFEG